MTDVYQRVGFVIAGAAIGAALHKLLQPTQVKSEITVPGHEGALPKRAKSGQVSEVSPAMRPLEPLCQQLRLLAHPIAR